MRLKNVVSSSLLGFWKNSSSVLLPVLDDFGQDVSVETDAHGTLSRARHHMFKVFLLDEQGFVREIYSVAFIQPQVILNDTRTLCLASGRLH
jgi:protein SCO1/2